MCESYSSLTLHQHDEESLLDDYREFYYDVEPECRRYGEVVQFKVCEFVL